MISGEEEARAWIVDRFDVPRETMDRLDRFVQLLIAENEHQNLISRGTVGQIWTRHLLDSAQILTLAPPSASTWLDLGSGAGFPGLVVLALWPGQVTMVESRRLRVDFLRRAAEVLDVARRGTFANIRIERLPLQSFDVISARAFAPLDKLLALAHPFSTEKTRWILPKGRSARSELEAARCAWQGDFRLEPSLTDPDAQIVVAEKVRPLSKRKL